MMPRGFVYFIQQEGTNAVKVGWSASARSLRERLKTLQIGSPYALRILCRTPGDEVLERSIHERLRPHRLRGEWFSPCDELTAILGGVMALGEEPTAEATSLEPFARRRRQIARRRPSGVLEKKGRWYYRPTSAYLRALRAAQGLSETTPIGVANSDEARRKYAAIKKQEEELLFSPGNSLGNDGEHRL